MIFLRYYKKLSFEEVTVDLLKLIKELGLVRIEEKPGTEVLEASEEAYAFPQTSQVVSDAIIKIKYAKIGEQYVPKEIEVPVAGKSNIKNMFSVDLYTKGKIGGFLAITVNCYKLFKYGHLITQANWEDWKKNFKKGVNYLYQEGALKNIHFSLKNFEETVKKLKTEIPTQTIGD